MVVVVVQQLRLQLREHVLLNEGLRERVLQLVDDGPRVLDEDKSLLDDGLQLLDDDGPRVLGRG